MAKKTAIAELSLDNLLDRTNTANPSKEDMALVRKHLDENPKMIAINDSTRAAMDKIVDAHCSDSALLKEITKRQFEERRKEMGYDASPWVVRSLIDQVILCEFRLSRFEVTHYNNTDAVRHTLSAGIYYEKRLTMMQKRYLKAVEMLAKVRKIMAEVQFYEAAAKAKSKQSTLASHRLYKSMSSKDERWPLRLGKLLKPN